MATIEELRAKLEELGTDSAEVSRKALDAETALQALANTTSDEGQKVIAAQAQQAQAVGAAQAAADEATAAAAAARAEFNADLDDVIELAKALKV